MSGVRIVKLDEELYRMASDWKRGTLVMTDYEREVLESASFRLRHLEREAARLDTERGSPPGVTVDPA